MSIAGSGGERMLQHRYGTRERADRFYDDQVLDHLNPAMRRFVARQELVFLATSDAGGECDSSVRAGPPGFVRTLDEHRLVWPEYRGNGVLASLGNIVENPHVGLLFYDFFDDVIGLHVNGSAEIVDDAEMALAVPGPPADPRPGRRAERWVVVRVEEAYIHCSKFIPRLYRAPVDASSGPEEARQTKPDYFATRSRPVPTAARVPRPVRWPTEWSASGPDAGRR